MNENETLTPPDFTGLNVTKEPEIKEPSKRGRRKANKNGDVTNVADNIEGEKPEKVSKYKAKQQEIELEADLVLNMLNGAKKQLQEGSEVNPMIAGIWRGAYIETCKKHNIGLMAKPEFVLIFSTGLLLVDVIPKDKTGDILAVAKNRIKGFFKREK